MSSNTSFSTRSNWSTQKPAETTKRFPSMRGTPIGSSQNVISHQHSSSLTNLSFNKTTVPKLAQRDTVRNPWDHTFIVPVECGRPSLPEMENRVLWANPDSIKLRDAQRSCVCAGLEWEIYIHPNRGSKNQSFALTVLPIRTVTEKESLPDNYKIRFTVTTRAVSSDPRSKSSASTQPYQWEREIGQISSNFDLKDQTFVNSDRENTDMNNNSQNAKTLSAYMEQLPFTIEDLEKNYCVEYEGNVPIFRLSVEIRCTFVRKRTMNRAYHGLMGAILMEEEQKVEKLEKELDQLRQESAEREKKTESKEKTLKEEVKRLEQEKTQQSRELEKINYQMFQMQELNSKEIKKLTTKTLENDKEFRHMFERERNAKEQIQQQIKEKDTEIRRLENRLSELQGKNEQLNQEIMHLKNEKHLQAQLNESLVSVDHKRQRMPDDYYISSNNNNSQVFPSMSPYNKSYINTQVNYNKSAQKTNEEQLDVSRNMSTLNKQNQMEKEERSKNQATELIKSKELWRSGPTLNTYKLNENTWVWLGYGQLSLIHDDSKNYRLVFQDYRNQQYVINTYVELEKIQILPSSVIAWSGEYGFYSAKFPDEEGLRDFLGVIERERRGSGNQSFAKELKKNNEEEYSPQKQSKEDNKQTEDNDTEEDMEEDKRTETNYDKHESAQQHVDESDQWDFSNTLKNDDNDGWGSNAKFDFGNLTSELNQIITTPKEEEEEEEKEKDTGKNEKETQDEDNCLEFTIKPIANLEEVAVASGHENEELVASIPFKKLFLWGKDVTKESTWKSRATASQIEFWQDRQSKKIRMTCLEEQTQKLRINQWVPPPNKCQLKKKAELAWAWSAVDASIAAENNESEEVPTMFSIKFGHMNEFVLFEKTFTDAQRNNGTTTKVGTGNTQTTTSSQEREKAKPIEKSANTNTIPKETTKNDKKTDKSNEFSWSQPQQSQSQQPQKPQPQQQPSQTQIQTQTQSSQPQKSQTQKSQPQPVKNNQNEIAFEQWEENERKKKNAEVQKAAALFGDNTDDQMGASGAVFQFDEINTSANETMNIPQFEVKGGVDLEFADHIPKADVSFGVSSKPESTNKNGKEEVLSAETTEAWPSPQKESHDENDDLDRCEFEPTTKEQQDESSQRNENDNQESGGFSQWTSGFAAFTGDDEQSGFEGGNNTDQWTFNNESTSFDFGSGWGDLTNETDTSKKGEVEQLLSEQPEGDNCLEYTLKPIVELEEKAVPSGTEGETLIHNFRFKKLHRWGKDVTGQAQWKARATDSSIDFWKNNKTGIIRMICREQLIEKLRMNQNVPADINITEKSPVHCQWKAVDLTIAEEDSSDGFSLWLVKFDKPEECKQFQEALKQASLNNKENKH